MHYLHKFGLAVAISFTPTTLAAPISVETYKADGTYSSVNYKAPKKAKKAWKIGVVLPTLQDPYWVSVNYGIVEEAKRLGVQIKLMTTTGYSYIDEQNSLIDSFLDEDVDALIVSPINSYVQSKKISSFAKSKKIPVVGLISAGNSSKIGVRIQGPRYASAYQVGEFLGKKAKGKKLKIALLPGPAGSGWAEQLYKGFIASAKQYNFDVVTTKWGDTHWHVQSKLVNSVLKKHKDIDFIVGNAVASDVAPKILQKAGRAKSVKVASLYISSEVAKNIKAGKVFVSANDHTVMLANLSVSAAVDLIEGRKVPSILGTSPTEITINNIKEASSQTSISPSNYKPAFYVNWQ